MLTKRKIGIVVLVLGAFVAGGFALNAFKVDAFGWGRFNGAGINSEEWQAKMQEWKDMTSEERQAKMEEFRANREECRTVMEELKNSEEWQNATQDERREMTEEAAGDMDCLMPMGPGPRDGFGPGFGGCFFGLKLGEYGDKINREVVNIENGIQITITSDNPDIVEKLQSFGEKINNIQD